MKPAQTYIGEKGPVGCSIRGMVAHLVREILDEISILRASAPALRRGVQLFQLESELDDNRLSFAPADQDEIGRWMVRSFALAADQWTKKTGCLCTIFSDAVSARAFAARTKTISYVRDCTELGMQEELAALDPRWLRFGVRDILSIASMPSDEILNGSCRMGRHFRLLALFAAKRVGATAPRRAIGRY